MNKLNLPQWAHVVEIATGIVVIISLIFVGVEIKQNTDAIKMQAYGETMDRLDFRSYTLATDPDMHRIATSAERSRSELTAEEWSRFAHFTLPHLAAWEFIFDAHTKDNVDWHQWQGFDRYFIQYHCLPGSAQRAIYHEYIDIWSDPFSAHIAEVEKTRC